MTDTGSPADTKPERRGIDPQFALAVYKRIIALFLLALGILEWAEIVGVDAHLPGDPFVDLPVQLQAAVMIYAVIDLVAAVGLWLGTAWGTVIWLFGTMSRIILHTGLAGALGLSPLTIGLQTVSVGVFLILVYLIGRKERLEVDRRRNRRHQP